MTAEDANQLIEVLIIVGHVIAFGFGVLAGAHR